MMAKLGNMNLADSTESLTSVLNSFKLEAEDAVGIVDKLVAVDNVAATSTKELAVALRYVAAVASEAGVTIEQLISYIAVISQTTRLNAEQIGQSLKTIFTRMQDIQKGGLDEEGMGINNVEIALKRVDITLRDSTTSFRDFGTVLEELAVKWDSLNEIEQANIAKSIAGVRQANMFRILMTNMNEALELQAVQYNSAGLAADRYQIYLQSVEAAQNKLKASLEGLWQTSIESGLITWLLNSTARFVDLIEAVGGLNTILPITIALLGVAKWSAILPVLISIASAFKNIFLVVTGLGPALASLGLGSAGIATIAAPQIMIIVLALGALAAAFIYLSGASERNTKAFEDSVRAMKSSSDEINKLNREVESVTELWKEYEELGKVVKKTAEESKRYSEIQNQLHDLFPELTGVYDENYNFLLNSRTTLVDILAIENERLRVAKELASINAQEVLKTGLSEAETNAKDIEAIERGIAANEKLIALQKEHGRPLDETNPDYLFAMKQIKDLNIELGALERKSISTENSFKNLFRGMGEAAKEALIYELDPDGTNDILKYWIMDVENEGEIERFRQRMEAQAKAEPVEILEIDTESFLIELETIEAKVIEFAEVMALINQGDISSETIARLQAMGYEWDDVNNRIKGIIPTLDEYKNGLFEATNGAYKLTYAQRVMSNTMRDAMTISAYGITLTQAQFATISGDMSNYLFGLATSVSITLYDINGVALDSSEKVATALINNLITYDSIITQMGDKAVGKMTEIANVIGGLFGFAGGYSPYKPTIPTYSTSGGKNEAAEAEKKAIEGQIKALEKKKDALKDTLDQFKKYITAQKESLKLQKEEKEFTDELMKKNLSLAKLKTNIAILALDDSEEARAQRIEMEEEAASLEEEISKDKEDRIYDLKIEALDKAMDNFEDNINHQMKLLDNKIDKLRDESAAIDTSSASVNKLTTATTGLAVVTDAYGKTMLNWFSQQLKLTASGKLALQGMIDKWVKNKTSIKDALAWLVIYGQYLNNMGGAVGTVVGGGGCFIGGTLVAMSNGDFIPIENVKIGDFVKSKDVESGELLDAEIFNIFHHKPIETSGYRLINDSIGVTLEHVMFISGQWKPALELEIGDYLTSIDGSKVIVNSIDWISGNVPVYNLHTNHYTHNYFANGVLVHNIKTTMMVMHDGGMVESHHDGAPDFAGGLKSNEVFAKLLTGELVATEGQMDNFMKNILPSIASQPRVTPTSSGKGGIEISMPITVMGNMDESVLPKMDAMVKKTITKLNDNLINRGFTRTATDFSV